MSALKMQLRHTRVSNKKRKRSQEESPDEFPLLRRVKDDIKYVSLPQKHDTFYSRHRRHGLRMVFTDNSEGVPYHILEFRTINGHKFALIDVWRKLHIQRSQIIDLNLLIIEDYIGACVGFEEELCAINMFSKTFFKQHRIENAETGAITDVGTNKWFMSPMIFDNNNNNNNNEFRKAHAGMVVVTDYAEYYPDIYKPEYLFCPQSIDEEIQDKFGGCVYRPQLNESNIFVDITQKDLALARIDRCIANKSIKYLKSELLEEDDYPLHTRMNNVFFNQKEELAKYKSLIQSGTIISKLISYNYLQTLLLQTFKIKVDTSSIGMQKITSIGTEKSLISNGMYIERYSMGFGIIHHLKLDDIVFDYSFKTIDFGLALDWIKTNLQIDHIIQINSEKSQSRLQKGQIIKIKYNRQFSSIYVANCRYFNVNRHFVALERRLEENSMKIRLKKVQGGYTVI